MLNVTVTETSAPSFLTVWGAGSPRPTASNLNWPAGRTVANLVEVPIGANGQVSFYNANGSTQVVADLEGYVAPRGGGSGLFNGLAPARICDTRLQAGVAANQCNGNGTKAGTLGPGGTVDVQVEGEGGVPAGGVSAVVLNVTVTDTTTPSFLTVWPQGGTRPTASNLNWNAGQTVPNRVIVPVGPAGEVSVFNDAGSANVIVDVGGWYTAASEGAAATGAVYTPVPPARICDTRLQAGVVANQCNSFGAFPGTLGPGASRGVTVANLGGVPERALAVVTNVTVTDTTAGSFLTVWPDANPRPTASDLNWVTGETVPNLVVVRLGVLKTGQPSVDVYNALGAVNVIVDVEGYYATPPGPGRG